MAIQHAYAELTLGRKPCKSMPPASEWRARPALLAPSRFTGIFKCDKALAVDPAAVAFEPAFGLVQADVVDGETGVGEADETAEGPPALGTR